jgi:hypothetical protein
MYVYIYIERERERVYVYIYRYIYIYIYIYIEREREREEGWELRSIEAYHAFFKAVPRSIPHETRLFFVFLFFLLTGEKILTD